jgi:hypothetical protein
MVTVHKEYSWRFWVPYFFLVPLINLAFIMKRTGPEGNDEERDPKRQRIVLVAESLPHELYVNIGAIVREDQDPAFVSFALTCKAFLYFLVCPLLPALRSAKLSGPQRSYVPPMFCEKHFYWLMRRLRTLGPPPLIENRCPVNYWTLACAVKHPTAIPFLEWTKDQGLLEKMRQRTVQEEIVEDTLVAEAAGWGTIEIIEWLMAQGWAWDSVAFVKAATNEEMGVL